MGYRNSPTERETAKGQFADIDKSWGPQDTAWHVQVMETSRHHEPRQYFLQNFDRVEHLEQYLEERGGRILSLQEVFLTLRPVEHRPGLAAQIKSWGVKVTTVKQARLVHMTRLGEEQSSKEEIDG